MLKHRNTGISFAVIFAVVAIWFSPWWAGGRVLAPLDVLNEMMQPWRGASESPEVKNHFVSDSVNQYLGYRLFAEEQLRSEGRIGWSDLTYGGTPAYANTMALYDDWSMQLHRWFDFWTAWHLGLIGQVLLAAVGMFLFLRGRRIEAVWAVAGAVAWAANSQFVTWINHRWALSAFCWLPWVFLAMDRWRRGEWVWGVLAPAFLALSFLGGTLQHSALMVVAVAGYWLAEEKGVALKRRLSGLPKHLIWGLLAVGLAGFMFLPQIEAFLISSGLRLHPGMYGGIEEGVYPKGLLQPLFNAASYPLQIFPWWLGAADSADLLKLFKSEWFYVIHFGSLPFLIGFLALFRRETPRLAWWLILFGLVLPLTPLVRLLYQRLYLLFIFGGILAFAHYMTQASRESRMRLFKWTAVAAGVVLGGWLGLSLFLEFGGEGLLMSLKGEIQSRGAGSTFGFFGSWIDSRADRFIERLFVWHSWQLVPIALFVLGVVGLRGTAALDEKRRRLGTLCVTLAVAGEVTLFAQRWVTWSDPERHPLYAETSETNELRERAGRIRNIIHPGAHMPNTPLMANMLVPYGMATINGYDSIVPNGMLLPNDPDIEAARLARCGVDHLVAPAAVEVEAAGWVPVWESATTRIYRNDHPAPRYAGFASRGELVDHVEGDGLRSEWVELDESSGEMNQRKLELPAGVAWVRVSENHFAGWEWRLASRSDWEPVSRAADGSMAIGPLPDKEAGGRSVEMRFTPPSRRAGWRISAVSLAALGGVGWFGRKGGASFRRPEKGEAP